VTPIALDTSQLIELEQLTFVAMFGIGIAEVWATISNEGDPEMQQMILWPTLAILAGATATIPAVQNSTLRHLLYWLVLSPVAVGLVAVLVFTGIR
jgi:hypothetical protein